MAQDNVQYDINGYDIITDAMRKLLNQFPLLGDDESINFSTIDDNDGVAFFPVSGGIIQQEIRDVVGHVTQTCAYPIIVFYKAGGLSENGKQSAKEWLDTLGKWLERQIIDVNGVEYQLTKYPPLVGDREFTDIRRTTPSYLMETSDERIDTWAINITATYRNEFGMI